MKTDIEKMQINYRNYFNQEYGTSATFVEMEIKEAVSFINNCNLNNNKLLNVYKSYPKKRFRAYTSIGKPLTEYKVGQEILKNISRKEYLQEKFYNLDFLIKYQNEIKKCKRDGLDFKWCNPELFYLTEECIEEVWEITKVEFLETQCFGEGDYYEEDNDCDIYLVTIECRTNPHSVYYEFESGLLRISNHWSFVAKNAWYFGVTNSDTDYFRAGFCKWEDFEINEPDDEEDYSEDEDN